MKRVLLSSINLAIIALGASFFSLSGCGGASSTLEPSPPPDPSIVALYGNHELSIDEFEKRYARSVGGEMEAAMDSFPDYSEFLDRYLDFRLKVMYAEELGLKNDSSIVSEIETYRKQLARPFLLERDIMDPIVRDLYEKTQNMVDASHILARVGRAASPEDTLAAYNKMMAIVDSLEQGIDFGDLAFRNSDDPSARGNRLGARGRLGYFIGGQMVKPFEDKAYSTPVDSSSPIFRTDFGYHILFVHDRRPRIPDVWASHIAVRPFPPGLSDTLSSEERIQRIYERLENGEDFATVAKEKSEDSETASRGGQFGRMRYTGSGLPEAFRDALFALENPGDYSEIIQTDYGYHIIRLDKREEVQSFEESYDQLKNQATRLPRVRLAEQERANGIRAKYGTAVDTTLMLATLEDRHFKSADILETPSDKMALPIATLGEATFTFGDIVHFAETASVPYDPDTLTMAYRTLDLFLNEEALNYEAARLESSDEEFRFIMEEFQDGLLLFKLMEDSVWTAAAADTASLMAYHSPRADSFWFPDRHRVITFRNRSDSLLEAVKTKLDEGELIATMIAGLAADTTVAVRIDTTYISEPNESIFDRALALKKGESTQPISNAGSYVILVNDGTEPARQKTFAEARSEVLNAYQEIVETKLLERLRAKYRLEAFHDHLIPAFVAQKQEAAENEHLFDNEMGQ